jgi:hypothetical protein
VIARLLSSLGIELAFLSGTAYIEVAVANKANKNGIRKVFIVLLTVNREDYGRTTLKVAVLE